MEVNPGLLGNNCSKLLAYLVNNIKSDHNREKPNKIRWEHQQNFQNSEVEFLDLFNYPSPYCKIRLCLTAQIFLYRGGGEISYKVP